MELFRFNKKTLEYELKIEGEWVSIKLIEEEIDSKMDQEDVKKAG